ncbi:hypothetical protein V1505DRAFT_379646 [Lipomyces doorenjongii]
MFRVNLLTIPCLVIILIQYSFIQWNPCGIRRVVRVRKPGISIFSVGIHACSFLVKQIYDGRIMRGPIPIRKPP